MLELNTTEGEVGIYAEHTPLAMVLSPGVAKIHESNGNIRETAIHSGFIQIEKKNVTVLAEIAELPEEIDFNRAEEARIRAERRLGSDSTIDIARAELALKKAQKWIVLSYVKSYNICEKRIKIQ